MIIQRLTSLSDISSEAWNALVQDNNPFLKHEFLFALEQHGCVGGDTGWTPCHLALFDDGQLIAASPQYIKYHSYGEFVFDWSWAEAYQRHGLAYYPKLLCAVPFTPLTGQRLLIAGDYDASAIRQQMIDASIQLAQQLELSSFHCLFPETDDLKVLKQRNDLSLRLGCQYHWHNQDYRDFEHYLSHFSSRKRKNIVKERRQLATFGLRIEIRHGDEMTTELWQRFYQLYCELYDRKWGEPSLTLAFFEALGNTMPDQVVVVLAYRDDDCIAVALNLRSDTTLYGRHWGCSEQIPGLHFECCYYQGLEYCLREGLQGFEPGAQGEHKIARGFLPTATWSAHWIADPGFRKAVDDFCLREQRHMTQVIDQLNEQSPFKR